MEHECQSGIYNRRTISRLACTPSIMTDQLPQQLYSLSYGYLCGKVVLIVVRSGRYPTIMFLPSSGGEPRPLKTGLPLPLHGGRVLRIGIAVKTLDSLR